MKERINYSERMLADNPTGLQALGNKYQTVEGQENEVAVL